MTRFTIWQLWMVACSRDLIKSVKILADLAKVSLKFGETFTESNKDPIRSKIVAWWIVVNDNKEWVSDGVDFLEGKNCSRTNVHWVWWLAPTVDYHIARIGGI